MVTKSKPHWSSEQIDILKQFYATADMKLLQKLFPDRSWQAILHKANRLKYQGNPVIRRLRPSEMIELTKVQQAYVAGILDGEGTITVSFGRPHKGSVMPTMSPLITITNSNMELISYLQQLLPGSTIKTTKETNIRKAVYTIQIARLLDIEKLIIQIQPYMVAKNKQASLLLKYCKLRKLDTLLTYNPKLFKIAQTIRDLNKRGPN